MPAGSPSRPGRRRGTEHHTAWQPQSRAYRPHVETIRSCDGLRTVQHDATVRQECQIAPASQVWRALKTLAHCVANDWGKLRVKAPHVALPPDEASTFALPIPRPDDCSEAFCGRNRPWAPPSVWGRCGPFQGRPLNARRRRQFRTVETRSAPLVSRGWPSSALWSRARSGPDIGVPGWRNSNDTSRRHRRQSIDWRC